MSTNTNMSTIEEMLKQGVTAEDLRMQFDNEIAQAQAKIKAEQEQKEKEEAAAALKEGMDAVRVKLLETAIEYLDALNIIDKNNVTDESMDELVEALKDNEDMFKSYGKIIDLMLDIVKDTDEESKSDRIIKNFLKGL